MISVPLYLLLIIASLGFSDAVRVVTKEELATKTTQTGDIIWLSIMGEVYDVSAGKEYYADGTGYSIFAGRDGNVPFITGTFTPEEADKSFMDVLTHDQIGQLDGWREFYEKEDKYPFVGLLEGELYDKDGNPTEMHAKVAEIVADYKVKAKEREKERERKIAERKAERAQRAKQKSSKQASAKTSEL